jgi:hypothetical protein
MENLSSSINQIVAHGQELRETMPNLVADTVQDAVVEAISETNQRTDGELATNRSDSEEIRREIEKLGEQVRVFVEGATMANAETWAMRPLLRQSLRVLLRLEGGEAVKAAKRQIHQSQSFLAWIDEFYARHAKRVREELGSYGICAEHIERSKQQLLAASDGDRDGFVRRIKDLAAGWISHRIQEDEDQYYEQFGSNGGGERGDVGDPPRVAAAGG